MNWDARISRAERAGKFIPADVLRATEWGHCAVGEKTDSSIFPDDSTLYRLGYRFYESVRDDLVSSARLIYDQINVRAKELGYAK